MAREFTAEVKEHEGGQPWLVIQPNSDNGLNDDQRIVLTFAEGTNLEVAESVARTLNQQVHSISVKRWQLKRGH